MVVYCTMAGGHRQVLVEVDFVVAPLGSDRLGLEQAYHPAAS